MSNLLSDYFNYIYSPTLEYPQGDLQKAITDGPEIYQEATLYSIIGTLMGRKRWLPFGHNHLYPNTWIVILGESSVMRKSTALSIGIHILQELKPHSVYPNEFSGEKILEVIQETSSGVFCFYEFATFLENMEKEYNAGTRSMLTELFDCPPSYNRATRQTKIEIVDPCLSILAASTPQWLKMSENNLKGGFLTRCLFVPATPKDKPFEIDIPNKYDITQKRPVLIELKKHIEQTAGTEYKLSPEAKERYKQHRRFIFEYSEGKEVWQIKELFARQDIYALKISMIIQSILNFDKNVITGEAMDKACNFVKRCMGSMSIVWGGMAKNKEDSHVKAVLNIIKKYGKSGISRSDLLRSGNVSAKQLTDIIETLKQSERIEVVTVDKVQWYKLVEE